MGRIDRTFFEAYGSKAFFKVKANAFGINKLQIDFVNKETKKPILLYVEIYKAVTLASDILSGRIPKKLLMEAERVEKEEKDKPQEKVYPKAVWTDMGGVSTKTAAERKLRSDGKALSRTVSIFPSKSPDYPVLFQAQQGPGQETSTGLIKPLARGEFERLNVPLGFYDLKVLALAIQHEWTAYLNAGYINNQFAANDSTEKYSKNANASAPVQSHSSVNKNNSSDSYYPFPDAAPMEDTSAADADFSYPDYFD